MNVLLLDGVSDPALVVLYRNGSEIARQEIAPKTSLSECLLPTIAAVLKQHGMEPHTLSRIGVVNEPASFTSLRITIAAANAIAYGLGIRLVSLSSETASAVDVFDRIRTHETSRQLLPAYGRPARITEPKRRQGRLSAG